MSKIFLFPDIETTGTDLDDDLILEIAWAFTNEQFEIVGEPRTFIVKPEDEQWAQIAHRLGGNDYVREMHSNSGLFADLPSPEAKTLDWIRDVLWGNVLSSSIVPSPDDTVHLAGLSVHFDENFLNRHGWGLEDKMGIHHRHLDLSSIKVMLETAGVEYEKATNAGAHRALNDVFEAIEQARILQRMFGTIHH